MTFSCIALIVVLTTVVAGNRIPLATNDVSVSDRANVVEHLTRKTMANDPKVHDIPIPYESMYNHIYLAYADVSGHLSKVVSQGNTIKGVNFVLHYPKLDNMYSPRPIDRVLNFVRACYSEKSTVPGNKRWIAILRSFDTDQINKKLIRKSTQSFKQRPVGEQLLVWEDKENMDGFLTQLGYSRLACGGNNSVCDWSRLGLPTPVARNQCLYGIHSGNQ